MKNQNKIMACVDPSRFADYVTDYAAWAAKKMHAPLELLHIIDSHPKTAANEDFSGTIGFDEQEDLLKSLSEQDASRNKMAREKGRLFLNQLRLRAIDSGVTETDVRQRHGSLVESLVEQMAHVHLVVWVDVASRQTCYTPHPYRFYCYANKSVQTATTLIMLLE